MKIRNPFRDLTRFEWGLWLSSSVAVLVSALLTGAGGILNGVAAFVGVTALIFVAKGYVIGQILTVVFGLLYGVISFFFQYYGEMITYLGMTAPMAVLTVIAWLKHPYEGTREVEVHRLSLKQWIGMWVAAAPVTVGFYYILGALGNANLTFSTISITTSFVASALTFFRSPWYAVGYAANDVVLIVLWVLAALEEPSYLPMVVCFFLFLLNDLYGFVNWRRMEKRQQTCPAVAEMPVL